MWSRSVMHRVLVVCAVALLGGAMYWWGAGRAPAEVRPAASAVPVAVTRVTRGDVPHLTTAIGTAQAVESVVIRPQLDGILTSLRFEDGQQVREGELLATLDDRSATAALQSADAMVLGSEAELASAKLDLRRYQDAAARGAIPGQTLDQQQSLVRQLEAALAEARAARAAARVTLAHTRISSPIAGRAGIRRVDVGNLVQAGDAEGLVTVSRLDPIIVLFSLPQDYLARVRALAGQSSAPVTALDRVGGEVLGEGLVVTVDNMVDPATGTIRVKARFPNPERRLWPGQFVAVRLATGTSSDAVTIPVKAIVRGRDQDYVYRVRDDVADVAAVTLGYESETVAVVASGLEAGDMVVTDGQSRVRPGSRVKILDGPAGQDSEVPAEMAAENAADPAVKGTP